MMIKLALGAAALYGLYRTTAVERFLGKVPPECRRDKSGRCITTTRPTPTQVAEATSGSFFDGIVSWYRGIAPNPDRDPEVAAENGLVQMPGDDCYTVPAWVPFVGGTTRCSERS